MFLGGSPPTSDDFPQLPSSLTLTRKELRKYHVVYIASLTKLGHPTFHYPGSAANTLEGAEPRIRIYGKVKQVAPEDIRRDHPHLERMAKHV
jgi:hypothetical protein